jgi:hypothetical protein
MIRDYQPEDAQAIKDIYQSQGFDYALPDLSSPLLLVKKVREVDGRVVGAMFLRITAETFLLVDGSPVTKGRSIEELQPEVIRAAWEKGLSDVVCVVPPEIENDFSPVLTRMGWAKERPWPLYSRSVE